MTPDQEAQVAAACATLGWSGLRPVQRPVVEAIFEGRDVLAVLPTSAGKSALYQIPALARPGLVVVVSPLIALMIDQVHRLRSKGVVAWGFHSHVSVADRKRMEASVSAGECRLLYLSPERLLNLKPEFFGNTTIQLVAIDEAHCISEWGHDFRPAYLRVGRSLHRLVGRRTVPRLAVTATATQETVAEMEAILGFDGEHARFVESPDRANLFYGVAGRDVEMVRMARRVEERFGFPCLVYGSTRRGVEQVAEELRRGGMRAEHYHAEAPAEVRRTVQDQFSAGELEVVCATCAFGMGIDNAGLRAVIHQEMPSSLEAYVQEAGRAGRDGRPSVAICRATTDSLDVARSLVSVHWPDPTRVRRFWNRLRPHFADETGGTWDKPGEWTCTTADLVRETGYSELEVGACLRILLESRAVTKVDKVERPVQIVLLSLASSLRGRRQREVVAKLEENADADGVVQGSATFFQEEIGLDEAYARSLRAVGAIRYTDAWTQPGMTLQDTLEGSLVIDEGRIRAVARRALARIDAAEAYLGLTRCRRAYLAEYFGFSLGASDPATCCDVCARSSLHGG